MSYLSKVNITAGCLKKHYLVLASVACGVVLCGLFCFDIYETHI